VERSQHLLEQRSRSLVVACFGRLLRLFEQLPNAASLRARGAHRLPIIHVCAAFGAGDLVARLF
jgi:hypothetical protein